MTSPGALLDRTPFVHEEGELASWPFSMFEPEISGLGAVVTLTERLWGASFGDLNVELVNVTEPDMSARAPAHSGSACAAAPSNPARR